MNNNYVYPAKICKENNEILLEFPDFPELLVSCEKEEEMISAAQEVLAIALLDYIDRGKEVPKPSNMQKDVVYIHVWLPYYKNIEKEVYVKKTVTIPQWLDILAKENKINFSATLVKGIKEELSID